MLIEPLMILISKRFIHLLIKDLNSLLLHHVFTQTLFKLGFAFFIVLLDWIRPYWSILSYHMQTLLFWILSLRYLFTVCILERVAVILEHFDWLRSLRAISCFFSITPYFNLVVHTFVLAPIFIGSEHTSSLCIVFRWWHIFHASRCFIMMFYLFKLSLSHAWILYLVSINMITVISKLLTAEFAVTHSACF